MRVVQLCTDPDEMWAKLWERYAGKTVANQISVLTTLINLKAGKDTDMGDHVFAIESLVNRLASMGMVMEEPMQVAILLVSLASLLEYNGTVSSIKTMDSKVATWTNVMMRIIEEQKQLKGNEVLPVPDKAKGVFGARRKVYGSTRKDIVCWHCSKKGHMARDYYQKKNGHNHLGNNSRRLKENYPMSNDDGGSANLVRFSSMRGMGNIRREGEIPEADIIMDSGHLNMLSEARTTL